MNALDNLLLILSVAVFLFYCYKKKKFFFSKLKKENAPKETESAPNGASVPNVYPFPHMHPQGIQYPAVAYAPTPPRAVYCEVIGVEKDVIASDTDCEYIINTELSKLTATGCYTQSVSVSECRCNTADGAEKERILFFVTYTK